MRLKEDHSTIVRTIDAIERLFYKAEVKRLTTTTEDHWKKCVEDGDYWTGYCNHTLIPGLSAIERFATYANIVYVYDDIDVGEQDEEFYSLRVIKASSCALLTSIWNADDTNFYITHARKTAGNSIFCEYEKLLKRMNDSSEDDDVVRAVVVPEDDLSGLCGDTA